MDLWLWSTGFCVIFSNGQKRKRPDVQENQLSLECIALATCATTSSVRFPSKHTHRFWNGCDINATRSKYNFNCDGHLYFRATIARFTHDKLTQELIYSSEYRILWTLHTHPAWSTEHSSHIGQNYKFTLRQDMTQIYLTSSACHSCACFWPVVRTFKPDDICPQIAVLINDAYSS